MKKRLYDLERLRNARLSQWAMDYPGGVHLHTEEITTIGAAIVRTARKLGRAVVLTVDGTKANFYGVEQ